MSKPPGSRRGRFFELARMTASVAGRYARTRVASAFQSPEQAAEARSKANLLSGERIARTLGELKGAVMKVGQMASLAGDILPPELARALAPLQKEAPPVPFEVIAAQVESELGLPPERLFQRFDPEPFAAASIGQVHRACTDDGREVVVKVQYPGVDESCDADLAQLKLALRASGLVRMSKKALDALFVEVRDRLHEELDYCNEADNVRLFADFHREHEFVEVPDVVGERSSQRVLTLSYLPGDPIAEVSALGYPQAARSTAGENLLRLVASQLFVLGAVHADPNPANFACRPDGTLILYDFGCVKKVEPDAVAAYRDLVRASLDEDYEGVERGMLAIGARNPDGPSVELDYYKRWRDIFMPAFLPDEDYSFANSPMQKRVMAMMPGAIKRMSSFQPPVRVVYVNRVVAGHFGTLRSLGAVTRFRPLIEPFLEPGGAPAAEPAPTER